MKLLEQFRRMLLKVPVWIWRCPEAGLVFCSQGRIKRHRKLEDALVYICLPSLDHILKVLSSLLVDANAGEEAGIQQHFKRLGKVNWKDVRDEPGDQFGAAYVDEKPGQ